MNWIKKLFKKKTELEKLNDRYDSLMEEAFRLSRTNRTKSDEKTSEADEVMLEIVRLEKDLYNKDRNL